MTWALTLSGNPGFELPEFASPPVDPIALMSEWFEHADREGVREPRAATLCTATRRGVPSGRTVLLQNAAGRELRFGTSSESRKGRELAENPVGSITVYWRELMRQITVLGDIEALGDGASDELFRDRNLEAQAASAVSRQSAPLEHARDLQRGVQELLDAEQPIPRPEHWRSYRLLPFEIEFWQGSEDRLHHRLRYEMRAATSEWSSTLLQP
jgi:dihydrophenazinedicarboxylate synthase